jgi:hypothetical protein
MSKEKVALITAGGSGMGAAAAELLDPALQRFRVSFRLFQVLFEAFLVGVLGGQQDVGLKGHFKLLLFAIGLLHVLDQLRVTRVRISHWGPPVVSLLSST